MLISNLKACLPSISASLSEATGQPLAALLVQVHTNADPYHVCVQGWQNPMRRQRSSLDAHSVLTLQQVLVQVVQ